MADSPSIALVASTYNWPEALELLLKSILYQHKVPDEIIIADDGSTEDTKQLIDHYKEKFTVPLRHVWHEDHNNRKAVILNKAIATSAMEYIIEVDGDVILHPYFVKDHLSFAQSGVYLYGSRVNIQKSFLPKLFSSKPLKFYWYSAGIQKRGRTLRIPFFMRLSKTTDKRSSKLRGCNVSFWRKDFITINGYNEDFEGWGMEDSEMIERLHNIGIKGKRLKFAGILYHIYHKEQSKARAHQNRKLEHNTIKYKLQRTTNGIDKYLL